jgi:hypothetical protein
MCGLVVVLVAPALGAVEPRPNTMMLTAASPAHTRTTRNSQRFRRRRARASLGSARVSATGSPARGTGASGLRWSGLFRAASGSTGCATTSGQQDCQDCAIRGRVEDYGVRPQFAHRLQVFGIRRARIADDSGRLQAAGAARRGHRNSQMQRRQSQRRQSHRCCRVGAAGLVTDRCSLGRRYPSPRCPGESDDLDVFWAGLRWRRLAHAADTNRPGRP